MLKSSLTSEANNLKPEEIDRYTRQMILPEISLLGQNKLKSARVLVIGAGGVGSTLLLYLASSGVGTIGIVDPDRVEETNLHRQIIHSEQSVGQLKVESAKKRMLAINRHVNVETFPVRIEPLNAQEIVSKFDLVLDGSDNALTRYLVNDACVLEKKVLISGAAVKFDGQITIYNQGTGPCYRCLYPECPKSNQLLSCSENGVLGMVPGLIGTLMAIECVKLLSNFGSPLVQSLIAYDSKDAVFRKCKIRGRQEHCIVCGPNSTISSTSTYDYNKFVGGCNVPSFDESLSDIEWNDALARLKEGQGILLDVRPLEQHNIMNFTDMNSSNVHIPLSSLKSKSKEDIGGLLHLSKDSEVYIFCRRGIASRLAGAYLQDIGIESKIYNVVGGLKSYKESIDPNIVTL